MENTPQVRNFKKKISFSYYYKKEALYLLKTLLLFRIIVWFKGYFVIPPTDLRASPLSPFKTYPLKTATCTSQQPTSQRCPVTPHWRCENFLIYWYKRRLRSTVFFPVFAAKRVLWKWPLPLCGQPKGKPQVANKLMSDMLFEFFGRSMGEGNEDFWPASDACMLPNSMDADALTSLLFFFFFLIINLW